MRPTNADMDGNELNAALLQRAEELCQLLLPGGHVNGHEYRAADIAGGDGQSLGVNLTTGVWADFAAGDKGGDLIDLIAAVKQTSLKDAFMWAKGFLGIQAAPRVRKAKPKTYKPAAVKANANPADFAEVRAYLESRGLDARMAYREGVRQLNTDKGPVIVFPYWDHDAPDRVNFVKYRPARDKHSMWTSKDSKPCLFGWRTADKSKREVVIVEGELDCLAMKTAGVTNALSVPRGGGEGEKQSWVEEEYDTLNMMTRIVLCLDNDEAGRAATEELIRRLGRHRCFVCDLGRWKDPNDALIGGADLKAIVAAAQTQDPHALVDVQKYEEELWAYMQNGSRCEGVPLPWQGFSTRFGIRGGESTVWAGISGHGKSQVVGQVMVNSIQYGSRWCVASMEFRPRIFLTRIFRQVTGMRDLNRESFNAAENFVADHLWLYDVQGSADPDDMLAAFEYAYHRYGVDNFLIDSLAKCGFAEDDYNSQKAFVDRISSFARDNNVHVHLVCHSRKKATEFDIPDKSDIKGTGGITDMVDNVFVVWRNKKKEQKLEDGDNSVEAEHDAVVKCCKQRNFEWEGQCKLWFDKASLQYRDEMNDSPRDYTCLSMEDF